MANSIFQRNANVVRMMQGLAQTQDMATAAKLAKADEVIRDNTATDLWKMSMDRDLYTHKKSQEFQSKLWQG
ncbi:MAG: hypothetical protein AAF449_18025 [Myxococcota bacterium]